jgi:hypothetical protein
MEATVEGGQGSEGAVVPWMDGLLLLLLVIIMDVVLYYYYYYYKSCL